jgi:membrane associated rhomboid family serine protease
VKAAVLNFLSSLRFGARLLVLIYALAYPLALLGLVTHSFDLYDWLALSPALVWKGEVWGMATYAFLPGGLLDWAVSLFWLATLLGMVGRNWSGRALWGYCLLATITGALVIVVGRPRMQGPVAGNGAMTFALMAAWYRLQGRERILLLGLGEVSVRQAVIGMVLLQALVCYYGCGLFLTLAMMSGGVVGWLYLWLREKYALSRRSQSVDSNRIARLEL